jgi:hypothetical protein
MTHHQLTVYEKYSRYWPAVAKLSALLAVLFFIAYQMSSDILIEGYLRLTAFGFFALSVLSLFKVRDGKMEISLTEKDGWIEIVYKVRNRIVQSEDLDLKDVSAIESAPMPDRSLYNNFNKSDRCVKFKRNQSQDWYTLHEIHGRVIPLSSENAESIVNYINERKTH